MTIDLSGIKPTKQGIGRRKEAVAHVKLYKKEDIQHLITGNSELLDQCFINGQLAGIFFQYDSPSLTKISLPFDVTKENQNFALDITVKGGGLKGQVDAIQLGISRALSEIGSDNRVALKTYGFLTRDSRIKESKKYGLKKARKAPQFSKR